MKKILLITALAATLATACSKNEAPMGAPEPETGNNASIAMSFVASTTRAFGSGDTEAWEKQIDLATIFVFAADGSLKFRRDLSAAEIANVTTTPIGLVVPGLIVGENCDFAVVANRVVPMTVVTKALLFAEHDADCTAYNGSFADATSKAIRTSGFVMSGIATQAIASGTTNVAIALERLVAKIEIQAATTPEFTAKYGAATVTVNKITLHAAEPQSTLMTGRYAQAGNTLDMEQISISGQNLFYAFENEADSTIPAPGNPAHTSLQIAATYDVDGDPATVTDQVPLQYQVIVNPRAHGEIRRNSAYKINVKIDGLTGSEVSMTILAADWATLITQDAPVGN